MGTFVEHKRAHSLSLIIDAVDYSVDPRVIGRFVEVTASPQTVQVHCDGQLVASHRRSWANTR